MSIQSGAVVVPITRPWRIRIKKAYNLVCIWIKHVMLIAGLCRRPEHCKKKSDTAAGGAINHMTAAVSNWELVFVNAVVAGTEAAGAVSFAFIPPLLLKAGYTESQMSILLGMCEY